MTVFAAPAAGGGSDVRPADLEGHLLVVEPLEYVASIPTSMGDKDAVRVTIHDITDTATYEDVLWFPKVLVGSLKGRVGQKVLAVLGKGTAKPGQSAPWILVDATTDNDCVQAATTYLDAIAGNQFTDPEVEQLAADSGNPALAAALGKLGARK
jgi:hypothetical protein